jgi:hypothetical protein
VPAHICHCQLQQLSEVDHTDESRACDGHRLHHSTRENFLHSTRENSMRSLRPTQSWSDLRLVDETPDAAEAAMENSLMQLPVVGGHQDGHCELACARPQASAPGHSTGGVKRSLSMPARRPRVPSNEDGKTKAAVLPGAIGCATYAEHAGSVELSRLNLSRRFNVSRVFAPFLCNCCTLCETVCGKIKRKALWGSMTRSLACNRSAAASSVAPGVRLSAFPRYFDPGMCKNSRA